MSFKFSCYNKKDNSLITTIEFKNFPTLKEIQDKLAENTEDKEFKILIQKTTSYNTHGNPVEKMPPTSEERKNSDKWQEVSRKTEIIELKTEKQWQENKEEFKEERKTKGNTFAYLSNSILLEEIPRKKLEGEENIEKTEEKLSKTIKKSQEELKKGKAALRNLRSNKDLTDNEKNAESIKIAKDVNKNISGFWKTFISLLNTITFGIFTPKAQHRISKRQNTEDLNFSAPINKP